MTPPNEESGLGRFANETEEQLRELESEIRQRRIELNRTYWRTQREKRNTPEYREREAALAKERDGAPRVMKRLPDWYVDVDNRVPEHVRYSIFSSYGEYDEGFRLDGNFPAGPVKEAYCQRIADVLNLHFYHQREDGTPYQGHDIVHLKMLKKEPMIAVPQCILQAAMRMLERDAEEGKAVRGELLEDLRTYTFKTEDVLGDFNSTPSKS